MLISKDELIDQLINVYDFGYSYGDEEDSDEKILERFKEDFKSKILNRIVIMYDCAKYVIIENNYVEREWKEMIAKHYLHSAYADRLKEKVIRIHFLSEESFCEENYLGYITLRPIEELSISLSFIYINWKQKFWNDDVSYVMTYEKKVHYEGQTISIHTYPFFSQDSIVTCCADANVIMLTKYLANKFHMAPISIMDTVNTKGKNIHKLPKKVDSPLLQSMLDDLGIPYRMQHSRKVKKYSESDWERIQKNIDVYIESGLPVILGLEGHVIQLIGHIGQDDTINKKYIVYDDSGHLEKLSVEKEENISNKFCYTLSIKDLRNYFMNKDTDKRDNFFILMSEHERIYIDFERYQIFLFEHLLYAVLDKSKDNSFVSKLFDENNELRSDVSFRNMLVDNGIVKEFIKHQETNVKQQSIDDLLNKGLPHYLWYTEIKVGKDCVCVCADPTMYYNTRDIKKLFFRCSPIALMDEKKLSLLTDSHKYPLS